MFVRNSTPDVLDSEFSSQAVACARVPRPNKHCALRYPCAYGVCERPPDRPHRILCRCDPGWVGQHCDRCCHKRCHGGTCYVTDNDSLACKCDWGYSGVTCNHKMYFVNASDAGNSSEAVRAGVGQAHGAHVVVAVTVVVVAVALCAAFTVLLWRRRFPVLLKVSSWWTRVSMRKNGVSDCSDVTSGGAHQYDAFVSFRSADPDESFVYRQLRPKLENDMGLKLCVHQRDFTPGETIANNILAAVKASRHTILVISRHYLQSEWTRMEYQVAQREMLALKHRVLPVLMEDRRQLHIDDVNLKYLLNSVTYLQWPGEEEGSEKLRQQFWKRLKSSLR